MIRKDFGEKVKEIRNSKLMSQDELASISGIDRPQISKIEKGKINVTLETIEKIASALNTSIGELMDLSNNHQPHPFVKWAGGKSQILSKLKEFMPYKFEKYYEPFIGGGALLFSIQPQRAYINDQNKELIYAYSCFQNDELYEKMKESLHKHEIMHNEEYYYCIRDIDRQPLFNNLEIYERAARMIYLNKACFNGLYRVNSKGYFNVPSGKKEKVVTFEETNFSAIKKYFESNEVFITNKDFSEAVENADKGDFVYFDPPYDVYPDTKGFVDYGKDGFGREEQIRLKKCFDNLTKRGVQVMLSNHNTPFINELYSQYNIHVIEAKRMINSKGDGRGNVQEVIITNY